MGEHDQPVAPNLLGRIFESKAPNERWVGDTTELRIGESGRLFLTVREAGPVLHEVVLPQWNYRG